MPALVILILRLIDLVATDDMASVRTLTVTVSSLLIFGNLLLTLAIVTTDEEDSGSRRMTQPIGALLERHQSAPMGSVKAFNNKLGK